MAIEVTARTVTVEEYAELPTMEHCTSWSAEMW